MSTHLSKMTNLSDTPTWQEIELSESYLVCCMFEEAASLSTSILQRLHETIPTKLIENLELDDMLQSTGMVLVQSLKELRRTSDMMNVLTLLFGSITDIPVQVLLTGACFQMSEGCSPDVVSIIEEFLIKWKYEEEKSLYVLDNNSSGELSRSSFLSIEEYLEVAEVYAVTLLGTVSGDNLAISWVEKAELPEEKRQEMLRRLRSLYSLKDSKSSLAPGMTELTDGSGTCVIPSKDSVISRGVEAHSLPSGNKAELGIFKAKRPSLEWKDTLFWWLPSSQKITSKAKIVLYSSLILFVYYILRRKGSILKRVVIGQALSLRKALIDFWQLAFSVQVNPLAAVQPPSSMTVGGR